MCGKVWLGTKQPLYSTWCVFSFNVNDLPVTWIILLHITDGALLCTTLFSEDQKPEHFLATLVYSILEMIIIIIKGQMFQVWDLATLQCIQTLSDHTSVVMSLLCWDQFLLSCSLDQTIKVSLLIFICY
jgi:WD40 repeat protein